ncbi:hypothetical protein LJB85_02620 [Porphyromonadaceae bacterium OttesenSCG-928-L07]|nr:hypothetical protein [Porphyromonadaceae bacterium OttesenSCG-928-L07]MDL2251794.1 hypothetical protein [Odoribacter sp. OttesenSCG-928-J03]MDL2330861.1 hypothetical protein [Odoribacter sp. OttesenSCG-928-A06]
MKIVNLLLLGLFSLIMLACSSSDDEQLPLQTDWYILQKNTGTVKSFAPYIKVAGYGAYNQLQDVSIRGRERTLSVESVDADYFQTVLQFGDAAFASDLYTVTAQSTDDRKENFDVYFYFDKEDALGELNVTQFERDSLRVLIVCDAVENATHYGVVVNKEYRTLGSSRAYYEYYLNAAAQIESVVDGKRVVTIKYRPDASSNNSVDIIREKIAVVAVNKLLDGQRIVLEGESKTMEPGKDGFLEDEDPV